MSDPIVAMTRKHITDERTLSRLYRLQQTFHRELNEPGNCRWATREEQANNTRVNKFVVINGKKQTIAQWCRELNISDVTVSSRIRDGWDAVRALLTPPDARKRNRRARSRRESFARA